ncbi:MAG: transglycosylase domain-containing protein [Magnetospiraceae bacterium]
MAASTKKQAAAPKRKAGSGPARKTSARAKPAAKKTAAKKTPRKPAAKPKTAPARTRPTNTRRKGGTRNSKRRGPARSRRHAAFLFVVNWGGAAAIWAAVLLIGVGLYFGYDLPGIDQAVTVSRQPAVAIEAADGTRLATFGDVYGAPVQVSEMPPSLPHAVIAVEDRRFYDHPGIDILGLARAMVANVMAGGYVQGGSTITQQTAKNLFLGREKTIKRKVQELMLAFWLEKTFTKDQILTLYLNRVYLGSGTYGVDAAARRYFGKSAKQVTLYESAMLAGLLKAPSRYNPSANPDLAAGRTKQVLLAMRDAGFIDETALANARSATLTTAMEDGVGRHFARWALDRATGFVGRPADDIHVQTTLNLALQTRAEALVDQYLTGPGAKAGVTEAAVVVLDRSGAVRAMVGGKDYGTSRFNRATQALRQPGSAFKPIVFLAGLQAGLTPQSPIEDAPITIDGWSPKNYDGAFHGTVSMQEALAKSYNTAAVRVAQKAGPRRVEQMARRLGITSPLKGQLGMALGIDEVTVLDLAGAYATLANGGAFVHPHGVLKVRDRKGGTLFIAPRYRPEQVAPASQIAALTTMMAKVMTDGTGKKAGLDRPAAGKTGTSQDNRDAWFAGFTADYVAVVWMGNDNGSPMKKVTGGGLPAQLWRDVMIAAHQGRPAKPLAGGATVSAPAQKSNDNFISSIFSALGD